jgi:hypothetical protein
VQAAQALTGAGLGPETAERLLAIEFTELQARRKAS